LVSLKICQQYLDEELEALLRCQKILAESESKVHVHVKELLDTDSTYVGLYEDLRTRDVESGVDMERVPVRSISRTMLGHQEVIMKVKDGSSSSSS